MQHSTNLYVGIYCIFLYTAIYKKQETKEIVEITVRGNDHVKYSFSEEKAVSNKPKTTIELNNQACLSDLCNITNPPMLNIDNELLASENP